jgi:pimeloyl-ACP methyl ester carboxylesterase
MTSTPPTTTKWRLDDSTSETFTLPDGRKLGYAQYGDPEGEVILYCHGFPGSRTEAAGLEREAVKIGAKIIAIDRAGYGWSSRHEQGTLISQAQDMQSLAEHLGFKRYGVLGISGGGPHALAAGYTLPADKLRAVSIVCGIGPPDMGYRGMKLPNYMGWTFGQRMFPRLCRWYFARETSARLDIPAAERLEMIKKDFAKETNAKDAAILSDENFALMHRKRGEEVYRHGTDGLADDFRRLNSDFGFKIQDIRKDLPVQLWHGREDVFVPPHHAEKTAQRLGRNAQLNMTDDTHASIWANEKQNYLEQLVKAVRVEDNAKQP